jgi:hypothetical protein
VGGAARHAVARDAVARYVGLHERLSFADTAFSGRRGILPNGRPYETGRGDFALGSNVRYISHFVIYF